MSRSITCATTVLHGYAQGVLSEISGGDFLQGFLSASLASLGGHGLEKLLGHALTTAQAVGFSALSGGIGAELSGGDFLKGCYNWRHCRTLESGQSLVVSDMKP